MYQNLGQPRYAVSVLLRSLNVRNQSKQGFSAAPVTRNQPSWEDCSPMQVMQLNTQHTKKD